MSIWITGDTHGNIRKFSMDVFPEQKRMTKDDYVIVCGDFGVVWNYEGEDSYEKNLLDWLESKPFTTLFIDGNHENFDRLYSYPVEEWHGGKVHKIRPSVIHLMRGEVFEIDGKKIWAFGGASSHDIDDGILDPVKDKEKIKEWNKEPYRIFRVNHQSWWKEELPSSEEMDNGLRNLIENDNEVDFIVTHCAPQQVASLISRGRYKPDILTSYFAAIAEDTKYTKWFFGHYHDNQQIMGKFIMLYEQIIRIN